MKINGRASLYSVHLCMRYLLTNSYCPFVSKQCSVHIAKNDKQSKIENKIKFIKTAFDAEFKASAVGDTGCIYTRYTFTLNAG